MKPVRVFVSATVEDLGEDCRPRVLNAVTYAGALAITMETWPASYKPAVEQCLAKIADSTHYLGVFAYYRGWSPEPGEVSITELEFEGALAKFAEDLERVAVFVPDERSRFARRLRTRVAAKQQPEQASAQLAFLKRVMAAATIEKFADDGDLGMRAVRRLQLWQLGPLLDRPQEPVAAEAAAVSGRQPRAQQVVELGRAAQTGMFTAVLQQLALPGATAVAAWLVHGTAGQGHDEMLARLMRIIESGTNEEPHSYTAMCGALWRQPGLTGLLSALGKEIAPGWQPASVAQLAERIAELRKLSDVVLRVQSLQNYPGGVAAFAAEFWQPLATALTQKASAAQYRMLCVCTHEAATPGADWTPLLETDPAHNALNATRIIALPEMTDFDLAELTAFARRWLAPADAALLATALLEETAGAPHLLYKRLANPATWAL